MASDLGLELSASRQRFLDYVGQHRPKLHRFCTRMTGSVLDGEDLVQETLAQAYYKLPLLQEGRPLAPWLFRIAHNKCIDFLRLRRHPTVALEETSTSAHDGAPAPESAATVAGALSIAFTHLPPMERACLLLKDVLDHSLADTAEIVGSSVGAVKSALHRARAKLREAPPPSPAPTSHQDPERERVVSRYVECFNRRDWDGVIALISADARLDLVGVVDATGHSFLRANYFLNYERLEPPWRMVLERISGEPAIVCSRLENGVWRRRSAIRLDIENSEIVAIRDYVHVDYLLDDLPPEPGI